MPNEKKNQHVDETLTTVNQAKRKSLPVSYTHLTLPTIYSV